MDASSPGLQKKLVYLLCVEGEAQNVREKCSTRQGACYSSTFPTIMYTRALPSYSRVEALDEVVSCAASPIARVHGQEKHAATKSAEVKVSCWLDSPANRRSCYLFNSVFRWLPTRTGSLLAFPSPSRYGIECIRC